MNIKEIETHWLKEADNAFNTCKILFNKKKYTESMFFLHLTVEKMLKGLFVNRMGTEPPWGHNLQYLASKIKNIIYSENDKQLFGEITTFNISARYDDYKKSFYILCDKKFARNYINKTKELLKWLKSQLR